MPMPPTPNSDSAPASFPPVFELAWGKRDRPTKGPKRALSLERIIRAGITVADTEGLQAVSMARVAREVGASTMSLYRYVASKDEMLTLMVDAGLGLPPAQSEFGPDWRSGLTRWAVLIREAYNASLWALRVPISAPPLGPNNVAWLEAALGCLQSTSLSEAHKLSTVLLISGFVRNEATLNADIEAALAADPEVALNYGSALSQLIDPKVFPAIQRALAAGIFDENDELEGEFEFGLVRILDGIEVLMADHSAPQKPTQKKPTQKKPQKRRSSS
jgi:AcrR family transcriptional regulator